MTAEPTAAAYESLIAFLYQAPIGLLQITADGDIVMMNPMSAQLLLPLAAGGELLNLFDLLAPFAPELRAQTARLTAPGEVIAQAQRLPLFAQAAEGVTVTTLELSLTRHTADTLMASLLDVSATVMLEQQRLAAQLHRADRTDSLTRLPNRAFMRERIDSALRKGDSRAIALLYINIDRFGQVNLSLGTASGDELLRQLAGRLNGLVRAADAVALAKGGEPATARLGGDEFVVLMEGMARVEDVHRVATRLVNALSKPFDISGQTVHVTASVGALVAHPPATVGHDADVDADAVLQDAAIAMREAKLAGGARYCLLNPAMKTRASQRARLEGDLRQALQAKELFVMLQPIVALDGSGMLGAEALARWRHPQRGLVPPIEFIPVAEDTGLIVPLGEQVLHEACERFAHLRRQMGDLAPTSVSVNLSRAQLQDDGLIDVVRNALTRHGLAPGQLQLEVTESLAAQESGIQARLHMLKALGVMLALDDFGTGYSSLAALHQLPVDVIKIDRSFVSQVTTSAHHRVLVQAVVQVCQSLGMSTVAEGIETPEQAATLAELGCNKGQGYWFARPMEALHLQEWLSDRGAPRAADR